MVDGQKRRKNRWMVGWIKKIYEKKMDGWMDKKQMDGWMDRKKKKKKMDGWMDKNMKKIDGWMEG